LSIDMTPEYINELADTVDPSQVWRLPVNDQQKLPPFMRKALDAGVALRRHAEHVKRLRDLLGTGKSLLLTPISENGSSVRIIATPSAGTAPAAQPVGIMSRATIATGSGAGYKEVSLRFADLEDAEQVRLWATSCGAQPATHRESPASSAGAPTPEAAHEMGAKGGPVVEAERLAFEAWMRGHCWALCATWTGTQYRSDDEASGDVNPHAMRTRQLWAAWRDRAALSAYPSVGGPIGWRPMDAAPTERGARFIGLTRSGRAVTAEPAYYVYDGPAVRRGWNEVERGSILPAELVGWMPLPSAPEGQG
jgi:hypothetical protein